MAIQDHTLNLTRALQDLSETTKILNRLHDVVVLKDDPRDKAMRPVVADITRDLLYAQHLLDAVKVVIGDEYWSIRGRG